MCANARYNAIQCNPWADLNKQVAIVTIAADMATFYNCKAIVGGNGTAYDSGKTGYAMMRVDTVGAAGYLTAG